MPSQARYALLAAAVILAAACPAIAQQPPSAGEVRVAVVDMDRVMAESEMGRAEQANIDRLKNDKAALISTKQKELDALEEQIRNASLSWSDERREEQVRQYEAKRIELRRLNEDATRDVQAEFNRALAKLQKAALEVTGAIGREKGYTLVFEKNTPPVLFASDAIEISGEVIQRLNARARPAVAPAKPAPAEPPKPGGGR